MANSHTLFNIITVGLLTAILCQLWVHSATEMMPHSWHWWLWSLVVPSCWDWVIRLQSSLVREARTEVGLSSFFSDFFLLMPDGFMLFPALKKEELICSQYHLCCFWLCQSSFLCIWQDVLTLCSPLCLSYPLSANFCYLGASYLQLHPSLVVMLLTYLCKMLIHCILLCLERYKILTFCC